MSEIKTNLLKVGLRFIKTFSGALIHKVPWIRAMSGEKQKEPDLPDGLEWKSLNMGQIKCEEITPTGISENYTLLYFHGGGGVLGLYNSSRRIIGYIAKVCGLKAVYPDYRLAPEFPFPAALEDCVACYQYLLDQGHDPKKIVILGDSMGGYLTLSALLWLRDHGQPLPAAGVLISPVTDPTCGGDSMRFNARKDALLSPEFLRNCCRMYAGEHDLNDPYLSPLTADLRGLPPILIQVGEDEILLDDSRRLHSRAQEQGAPTKLEVWPHMWHDWHICAPGLDEANQAIDHIAGFVGRKIYL